MSTVVGEHVEVGYDEFGLEGVKMDILSLSRGLRSSGAWKLRMSDRLAGFWTRLSGAFWCIDYPRSGTQGKCLMQNERLSTKDCSVFNINGINK